MGKRNEYKNQNISSNGEIYFNAIIDNWKLYKKKIVIKCRLFYPSMVQNNNKYDVPGLV